MSQSTGRPYRDEQGRVLFTWMQLPDGGTRLEYTEAFRHPEGVASTDTAHQHLAPFAGNAITSSERAIIDRLGLTEAAYVEARNCRS